MRGTRWLGAWAYKLARAAAEHVRVGGYTALSPAGMGALARNGVRLAAWAIGLFLGYLWLAFALRRGAWGRAAQAQPYTGVLSHPGRLDFRRASGKRALRRAAATPRRWPRTARRRPG